MKRTIILVAFIYMLVQTLPAQVKIPFDVPSPTWEFLITPKQGCETPVFEKANASSEILASRCGEDCSYQWVSGSWVPEFWERVILYEGEIFPFISEGYGWVNFEFNPTIQGWAHSRNFRKVETFPLTPSFIESETYMLGWQENGDLYVITEGNGGPNYQDFYVGKLKDGYVVSPYVCVVDMDGVSNHPGILNGVVGKRGISTFTRRDVDYILSHAVKSKDGCLVAYGFVTNQGNKEGTWLLTSMVADGQKTAVTTQTAEQEDNQVYNQVETHPQFSGGTAGIFKHIALKMKYPAVAQQNKIQGKVIVSFVIEKDGSVGDVSVVKGVDSSLDKEAVRVVKTLPKFTAPAKINGRPVRFKMNLPITFRLK